MLAYADMMLSLTRVEEFYKNAYDHLVNVLFVNLVIVTAVLGVVGVVVGVLVPLWARHSQRRDFQQLLDAHRSDIKKRMDETTQAHETKIEGLYQGARIQVNHHSAIHWYEMAQRLFKPGEYADAARYLCYSIDGAIEACWRPKHPKWEERADCLRKLQDPEPVKEIARCPDVQDALLSTFYSLHRYPDSEVHIVLRTLLRTLFAPKEEG